MSLKSDIIDSLIFSGEAATEEQALNDRLWSYYVDGEEDAAIETILNSLPRYNEEKYQPPPPRDEIENALGLFPRTRPPSPPLPGDLIQPGHINDIPDLSEFRTSDYMLNNMLINTGLTGEQLAAATGFSASSISRWRSGTPIPPYALHKLLNTFWPRDAENSDTPLTTTDKNNIRKLVIMVNPGIVQGTDTAWLDAKIEQRNWLDITLPAFCPYWLAQQQVKTPGTNKIDSKKTRQKKAGALLRACRKYREEQDEDTPAMHTISIPATVVKGTRKNWEMGKSLIEPDKLGNLIATDKPFPECIYHLTLLTIPELNTSKGRKWLCETIHSYQEDWSPWSRDVFSPRNSRFLNVLSKKKRTGWVLGGLREAAGKTQDQLAAELKTQQRSISGLELGNNRITYHRLGQLIAALKPSQENIIALAILVIPELDCKAGNAWLTEQIDTIGEDWEQWNQDVFSFTDDRFRSLFPEDLQGGYFLRALREKTGLSRAELGERLGGISQGAIANWEIGAFRCTIDVHKTPLTTIFNLFDGPEEEKPADVFSWAELETAIKSSNLAIEKRNALRTAITNTTRDTIVAYAEPYRGSGLDEPLEDQTEIIAEIVLHRPDISEKLRPLIAENDLHRVVQIIASLLEHEAYGKNTPEDYDETEVVEEAIASIESFQRRGVTLSCVVRRGGESFLHMLAEAGIDTEDISIDYINEQIHASAEALEEAVLSLLKSKDLSMDDLFRYITEAGIPEEYKYLTDMRNQDANIAYLEMEPAAVRNAAAGMVLRSLENQLERTGIETGSAQVLWRTWRNGTNIPTRESCEKIRVALNLDENDPRYSYFLRIVEISRGAKNLISTEETMRKQDIPHRRKMLTRGKAVGLPKHQVWVESIGTHPKKPGPDEPNGRAR